jgi:hypothetical protein
MSLQSARQVDRMHSAVDPRRITLDERTPVPALGEVGAPPCPGADLPVEKVGDPADGPRHPFTDETARARAGPAP